MNFRPDIQGLRAIAVLSVIIFHVDPAWLPGGYVGVDIFLVISGFLISSMLLDKKSSSSYSLTSTLNYFYSSRIKRILPAYISTLILVSLVAAVMFVPADFANYKGSLKSAAYFNSNTFFANFGDYFAPASHEQPLLHTWSLAIEIQFYLIAPFIILLLPKKWLYAVLPIAIILLTGYAEYRLQAGIQQATYYSLPARFPALLSGSYVALVISDQNFRKGDEKNLFLSILGIALITAALINPEPTGHFPGIAGLVPVVGAALIIWLNAKNQVTACLSTTSLVWIGALSYSLYLWHWPVLAFMRYYTDAEVLPGPFILLFIALTLGLSMASYYWIETPLRRKRSRAQIIGYICLSLVALTAAAGIKTLNAQAISKKLPVDHTRYADPLTICHGKIVADCLKGDLKSDKEVLVLGDSHAAMLNLFFDQLGKELGFKARIITASSCVTIPGFDYLRIPEWARQQCLAQIEEAKKHLPRAKIIFLAARWEWQLASGDLQVALETFLNQQSHMGKRVYMLEQIPILKKNPLRAIHLKNNSTDAGGEIDNSYQKANSTLQGYAKKYPGVNSLNFEDSGFFYNAPFVNGVPIYYDQHHLNEVGAKLYANAARSTFEKIVK